MGAIVNITNIKDKPCAVRMGEMFEGMEKLAHNAVDNFKTA